MTTKRNALLTGMGRAAELHAQLGLREKLSGGDRPIDVLSAINALGVMVLFRPLKGLLGAYVPTPRSAGMMITTERDHHVQRFTAAHELGHHALEHRVMSLDKDVGYVGRGEQTGYDFQEVEADAFAAEFLLPKWLIVAHARRHRWGKQELRRPDVVYQLSLRLGASYSSTCWALATADIVTQSEARLLADRPPKESKQRAIAGIQPASWHPDVWLLSQSDRGAQLLGSPNDFLVFDLEEHVAGGYEWNVDSMSDVGLAIQRDERRDANREVLGATVTRHLVAQGQRLSVGRLQLAERRPWEAHADPLNTFELDLALLGKEPVGLPRRERLMAA